MNGPGDILGAVDEAREESVRRAEAQRRVDDAHYVRRSELSEVKKQLATLEADVAAIKKALGL